MRIFVFEFHIRFPRNIFLVNLYRLAASLEAEGVVEETLGYQSAGDCGRLRVKFLFINIELLLRPQVFHLDHWVTIGQLVGCAILS